MDSLQITECSACQNGGHFEPGSCQCSCSGNWHGLSCRKYENRIMGFCGYGHWRKTIIQILISGSNYYDYQNKIESKFKMSFKTCIKQLSKLFPKVYSYHYLCNPYFKINFHILVQRLVAWTVRMVDNIQQTVVLAPVHLDTRGTDVKQVRDPFKDK